MTINKLLLALIASVPFSGNGASLYTYVGNAYTVAEVYYSSTQSTGPSSFFTTSMSLNGSFRVNDGLDPLLPLADIKNSVSYYSFSNGHVTLTDENSEIESFQVATDSMGNLVDWSINILDRHGLNGHCSYDFVRSTPLVDVGGVQGCDGGGGIYQSTDSGRVESNPGIWSQLAVTIPKVRIEFLFDSFTGFDGSDESPPTDPVHGVIEWYAESLLSPIKAITYLDLIIGGHPYSLEDISFEESLHEVLLGVNLSGTFGLILSGRNNFELYIDKSSGAYALHYGSENSADRWISGNVVHSEMTFSPQTAVVPVPAAAWLFASALLTLSWRRRRRPWRDWSPAQ